MDRNTSRSRNTLLDYEYELDKSTGEVVKKYVDILHNDGFKKVKTMKVKEQTTGDYDSLEDIAMAIMNLRTVDGKLIGTKDAYLLVRQFMDNMLLSSNPEGFKDDLEL